MDPLTIQGVQDEKDLELLINFMSTQSQHYPQYKEWLHGKCKTRIESGRYIPIIVKSDDMVVGNAVYQFLEDNRIEIKNFRIDENYQNRDLGHFLLNQVQAETNNARMDLDVSVKNFAGVQFFVRNNFQIVDVDELYQENQSEYIMTRQGKA